MFINLRKLKTQKQMSKYLNRYQLLNIPLNYVA